MGSYLSFKISVPDSRSEAMLEFCQGLRFFSGLQELSDDGEGLISPPEELSVLEFGSEASRRFDDFERRSGVVASQLQVFLLLEAGKKEEELKSETERLFASEFPGLELFWQSHHDQDYLAEYKKNVKASEFSGHWVGPPWTQPPDSVNYAYFVEPGMAFGTGDHPTTQLCMEFASELKASFTPRTVLDLGCGSGILALHALRLWPDVDLSLSDLDPECEREVEKTFALNGASLHNVNCFFANEAKLEVLAPRLKRVDLLLSNIYSEVLAGLEKDVNDVLEDEGYWVLSGILEGDPEQLFLGRIAERWEIVDSRRRSQADGAENWVGMLLKKR